MSKLSYEKKPLYRKVNTRARHVQHNHGPDFKDERNTKATRNQESMLGKMKQGVRRGLDYTPLFRFLVSKVGEPWDNVYSEALSRLDNEEPIFLIVARPADEGKRYHLIGESSYFSGLHIDDAGVLQLVDPLLRNEDLWPFCPCCTHTLNGEVFRNEFDQDHSWGDFSKIEYRR